jgi:ribonuclease HI
VRDKSRARWLGRVIQFPDEEISVSGTIDGTTTSNRAEMVAALQALQAVEEPANITVWADSEYLRRPFADGRVPRWRDNAWRRGRSGEVKNRDLWAALLAEESGTCASPSDASLGRQRRKSAWPRS